MKKKKSAVVPYAVYESTMARYSHDKRQMNATLIFSVFTASVVAAVAVMVNSALWQKYLLKIIGK